MKSPVFALLTLLGLSLGSPSVQAQEQSGKIIRIGMIGLDTSHVPAFTRIFNNPKAEGDLAGFKVVVGYPGGTDIPASKDRVQKFTEQIKGMGVEIVDTIPKLLEKCDVVLLESVDGRIHLQEALPVIKAGKPVFIDKPVAGSLVDAIIIYETAKKHGVPVFSSSSYRFYPGIVELKKAPELGTLTGASVWGPCSYQEGTPDLFFYGIHGIEGLFTLMGTGCESVSRVQAAEADQVTGVWSGGRVGTYRGIRKGNSKSGAVAYGANGIVPMTKTGGYEDLCREIAKFFKTAKPPVSPEETIEIFTFMEAADQSKAKGGASVALADVLAKAKADAKLKMKE